MAGLRDKIQRMLNPPDDEYEDYYEDEPAEEEEYSNYSDRRVDSFAAFAPRSDYRDRKVVNINQKSQMQVVVFKPTSFSDDAKEIADELLKRHTVLLNLEKTDKEASRRLVDFLSGVAYANNGKLKPIAANIVILTPYNVDLTGDDLLDELGGSGIYF